MYMSNVAMVDDANVDISNFVESSSQRIRALEAWACQPLQIMTKEFEIVEKGFDLGSGIKDSLLPNVVS